MEHVTTDRRVSLSPSFSAAFSFFFFLSVVFFPHPHFFSLCPPVFLFNLTHTFLALTPFMLFAHNPMSMHTVISLWCWLPCNAPSLSFTPSLLFCVVMRYWNHNPPPPPSSSSMSPFFLECAFSLFILYSFLLLLLSLLLSHLPSGGSLSPPSPSPLSAVPVGLWAGRVWAPAAFSKASAAAPATDPSNTATLTSIYTYTCL